MAPKTPAAFSGALAASVTAAGIIGLQVAGKAIRDALFLTSFHVRSLPLVMAAGAALSLLAVLSVSRVLAARGPRRVLYFLFVLGAVSLVLEWALIFVSPPTAAVAVYLHVAVLSPVALSTFWSLINEQFDPHAAKAAVSRIAVGGAVGGVLGGIGAWRAASLMNVLTSVLALAGANLLCLGGVIAIPRRSGNAASAEDGSDEEVKEPLRLVWKDPYLRHLALLVALGAAMSSLLDYVFSAQVTARYGNGQALLAFFGLFGVVVSVLSLLLQSTLGRLSMEKLGVAVNIAVLPGIILLGGTLGLAVPGLASATLLRGAEMVQRNTLFRAAYELLYMPLKPGEKRATKIIIDVGFDRLGTVVGSGIVLAMLALWNRGQAAILGAVVVLAVATLPIVRKLHGGYVEALAHGLRDGERALAIEADDAARSTREPDERARDKVIQKVEAARAHDDRGGRIARLIADPTPLRARAEALLSNDVERATRALEGWSLADAPLAGFAVLLLAHGALHRAARAALRTVAPEVTGQLFDALLDPHTDFIVRRRVPAVLAACTSQRAANGLVMGLSDARFEVRYACGPALVRVADRGGEAIVIRRDTIVTLIERESARATSDFEDLEGTDDDVDPLLELVARDRVSRSVEHLFTLLSLIVDREPLRLCFRALHQDDARHRGTALEYLQAVLPAELRDALLPLVGNAAPLPPPRDASDVLADLSRAMKGGGDRPEGARAP